eukprot:scaffold1809_cov386-Prasinococcus_capsulatus_cf.AAC.42
MHGILYYTLDDVRVSYGFCHTTCSAYRSIAHLLSTFCNRLVMALYLHKEYHNSPRCGSLYFPLARE